MNVFNAAAFKEKPSCVLVDLDNTLYAYDPAHAAGLASVREFAGSQLNLKGGDFDSHFEGARAEIKNRLGHVGAAHNRLLYFQRTLEKAGLGTQAKHALQMEQAYWSAFLAAAELFPEALEFLDDLRIAGVSAVIVTDLTAQIQHRKMLFFGLNRYVDWMVTSEEAGGDKPDPRMFELALAKIGGVEGSVWMLGDSPRCDMAGAKKAIGAITIQKLHAGVPPGEKGDEKPDASFKEFSELRRMFSEVSA